MNACRIVIRKTFLCMLGERERVKSRGKEEEGRRVEWGFLAGLLGQGKVEEVVIHPLYLGEEERERRRRRIGAACPVMSFS